MLKPIKISQSNLAYFLIESIMGYFSGKKRITVTGIHQRMMSDDDFTYSSKVAMAHWIWDSSDKIGVDFEGKDLSDYLIEASQQALPRKFDKLYRYAKKDGKYIFGLPVSYLSQEPENQILKASIKHLEALHGGAIDVFSFEIGDRDLYMEVWSKLVTDYGYNTQTNELTVLSKRHGYPCYLQDGYLAVSENTKTEYEYIGFDNPSLPLNYGKYFDREESIIRDQTPTIDATSDHAVITYGYEMDVLPEVDLDNLGEAQYVEYIKERVTKTIQIDLSYVNPELNEGDDIPKDTDWVYLTYKFNDDYYWFKYEYLSGQILSIDNALKAQEAFGEYYPRLYVRLNQSDIIDWKKDDLKRKDSERIFKKLDLNLKDITKQMHQSVGGEYGNVRGLYLFMGVQVNASKNQTALAEYCFNYFKKLFDLSKKEVVHKTIKEVLPNGQEITRQVVDDSVTRCVGGVQTIQDKESSQALSYQYMDLTEHDGVVSNELRPLKQGEYCLHVSSVTHTRRRGLFRKKRSTTVFTHIFHYQIEANKYISLKIVDLRQTTYLSGFSFDKRGDDGEFVIPIDRSIIKHLTNKERELLFHKSFHVCLLHVKITKVKWYQRGAFKVLLAVVAIAISIYTGGMGSGFLTMVRTATVSALKAIAISYAVNAVLKVAVKLGLDPKIAGIIAFVATIAVTGMANGFDFSKILTAPNIMKAVNNSFDFYSKMLQAQYMDTINQMKKLNDLVKTREEIVKDRQRLLDTKVFNPTQEMLRSNYTPSVNLFETPQMFYYRHYNYNVVAVSHGLITDLVEGTLNNKQLYKPKQEDVEDVLLIE
ncbi:hypothetical protein LP111_12655 [Moraxella bovis]|uniref:Uncharacterized protein n=1 Tax=Moraxella bovis TaxID=476 RepID=A0ABY6M6B1_MORBO|nr:hypothetical protein [Moraxella bovis]UZA02918.1 hypothetical protein LP092_13435 [Moraxella bovis]UZA54012.1 hypothetical protein LP111_12655 [Moraxella bovis]